MRDFINKLADNLYIVPDFNASYIRITFGGVTPLTTPTPFYFLAQPWIADLPTIKGIIEFAIPQYPQMASSSYTR